MCRLLRVAFFLLVHRLSTPWGCKLQGTKCHPHFGNSLQLPKRSTRNLTIVRYYVKSHKINKNYIFLDITPCSLVEIKRRFRCANCPDDGAVRFSETSVYFHDTTRYKVRQDSNLHSRRSEDLKFCRVYIKFH
jgi:hypothetical protein